MNEVSLKPVIEELENLFSKFNARFFADKLEKPVITVSPDHTRGAYGWCTGWKAWKAGEDEGHYEINLCAEYLNRPFEETCGTLIHEMVHLQNLQDGVQDTSRSGTYHNKKFKETAEAHGLTVEKGEKYGWHKTALSPEALEFVQSLGKQGFTLVRPRPIGLKGSSKGGGSSSRKYVCPCCGAIIRATKEVHVISFIAAAMLLILCTACHVAESHNEVLAQENTVNGGYTITDITDPVEVQSYIEQQGGEYTADIMAVHQVTFTDYTVNDITDPAEIKAYLESQGQEYNENITAIHQITFIDGEATPEGSLCEVEK